MVKGLQEIYELNGHNYTVFIKKLSTARKIKSHIQVKSFDSIFIRCLS